MKYSLLAFFFCLNLAVSAVETVTLPIPLFGSGTTGYRQGSTEIGGDKSEKLHFTLDPELLRRAVIKPEDLTLAKLTVAFIGVKGDVGKSELVLSSEDHVLGRIPLSGLKPGTISFDNLGDFARTLLKKQQEPLQMTLSVAGGEPTVKIQRPDLDAAMQMHPFSLGPTLQITIVAHPKTELFKFDVVPRPGVYAVVKDGHITYGGERLRLWGACRHPSQNLDTARRLRQMGFNGIRLWGPVNFYNPASGKDGSFKTDYRPDGSGVENFDRFFAEIKKQGCFIICPTLHYEELITKPDGRKWISTDDSFVSGGDDWEAWKEGISQIKDRDYRFFVYFDERLQKVRYKH
ncbi:MAG: hypothetical protein LBM70_02450, partial [Victivallales bacterium]|nr:hypothetical protein [Victivallales bacterium]